MNMSFFIDEPNLSGNLLIKTRDDKVAFASEYGNHNELFSFRRLKS